VRRFVFVVLVFVGVGLILAGEHWGEYVTGYQWQLVPVKAYTALYWSLVVAGFSIMVGGFVWYVWRRQ